MKPLLELRGVTVGVPSVARGRVAPARELGRAASSRGREALREVSFELEGGRCLVVVGPNGSGKTTLLRVLALLQAPTSGTYRFDGVDVGRATRRQRLELRRRVAFLRQKPVLLDATVEKNVAFGLRVRGVPKREAAEMVGRVLEEFDLLHLRNQRARALSGGEVQRVALAQVLALPADLVLLDEVSANLDPENVDLAHGLVRRLRKDPEKTLVLSTHDPTEALAFADVVGVLRSGCLVQLGPPAEVFLAPKDDYAARFVGYANVYAGSAEWDEERGVAEVLVDGQSQSQMKLLVATKVSGQVKACVRPESVVISLEPPAESSARNALEGRVVEVRDAGQSCHVLVEVAGHEMLVAVTRRSRDALRLRPGTRAHLTFKATDVRVFPVS